jgi:phage gpG-like protein
MRFEFSEITLPPIPNKLEGERFERFKRDLSAVMFTQRMGVFEAQASRDGPWKPLAPATMRERLSRVSAAKRGNAGAVKILQDRGVLRQSFTPESGPGSAFKHVEIGEDYVRNSTNVEYARIHNEGGQILRPNTRTSQAFKHYTSGPKEGRIEFASKKDIAKAEGRNFQIIERGIRSHALGSYITIPARPFDQFTDENEHELAEVTEKYLSGKL